MKPLLFSLLSLCLLAGCKKEEPLVNNNTTCPVKCTNVPMRLSFSNAYTPDDIDTLIVNKYTYGASYSQLEASTTYTLADTVRYEEHAGIGFNLLWLKGDYDYEIIIPATGQTFRVSNIVDPEEYREFGCGKLYTCGVPVREFSLSGGDYKTLMFYYHPIYLQLQK